MHLMMSSGVHRADQALVRERTIPSIGNRLTANTRNYQSDYPTHESRAKFDVAPSVVCGTSSLDVQLVKD